MKDLPKRYENIYKIIDEIKPKIILEIGTWNGHQAVKMVQRAAKHQANGIKGIFYLGFDLFEDITDKQIKTENSKKAKADLLTVKALLTGIGCKFNLIQGNTRVTLREQNHIRADLIYIDGGHSLITIDSDWKNSRKFCHSKTVTILDDYYPTDESMGCKNLIDGLSLDKHDITWLEPIDEFEDNFKVQMVKVTTR